MAHQPTRQLIHHDRRSSLHPPALPAVPRPARLAQVGDPAMQQCLSSGVIPEVLGVELVVGAVLGDVEQHLVDLLAQRRTGR
ncbi:MAG: hypothetical protein JO296_06330 [Pseudonocardiales bacterium]|nr:hypothetical protein [Pseudonocardiales bacterium]